MQLTELRSLAQVDAEHVNDINMGQHLPSRGRDNWHLPPFANSSVPTTLAHSGTLAPSVDTHGARSSGKSWMAMMLWVPRLIICRTHQSVSTHSSYSRNIDLHPRQMLGKSRIAVFF